MQIVNTFVRLNPLEVYKVVIDNCSICMTKYFYQSCVPKNTNTSKVSIIDDKIVNRVLFASNITVHISLKLNHSIDSDHIHIRILHYEVSPV